MQKHVYNLLIPTIPNDFAKLFKRRFCVLGMDGSLADQLARESFPSFANGFKALLKPLHKQSAMAILRTWSNGWFTTYRTHEPELFPCIFGCSDDIPVTL